MFSFAMMSAPFGGAFPGKKKRPLSMKDQYGIDLWDKSRKTSAVPPKLAQCAHSATCHHTPFLGNGGKARRCLLNCPVRPALHGPFHERLSAALSLPAARWGKCPFVYLLRVIGFGFEIGASIRRPRANVKRKFAVSSKKLKISRTFPTKTANRTKKCEDGQESSVAFPTGFSLVLSL